MRSRVDRWLEVAAEVVRLRLRADRRVLDGRCIGAGIDAERASVAVFRRVR